MESKRWDQITGFFPTRDGIALQKAIRKLSFTLDHVIVEIGSFLGRSTACMAEVSPYRIVAIDPHDGTMQRVVNGMVELVRAEETFTSFVKNMELAGTLHKIDILRKKAEDVTWNGKNIALLLIDGIHDKKHVESDFYNFTEFISANGFCVFHDYGTTYYPDVKKFVDSVPLRSGYKIEDSTASMAILRKVA